MTGALAGSAGIEEQGDQLVRHGEHHQGHQRHERDAEREGGPAGAGDAVRSPRPKARPTRTVTAWLRPNGTMKVKAAIWSATAWAATETAPISPIRKTPRR